MEFIPLLEVKLNTKETVGNIIASKKTKTSSETSR